MVYCCYGKIYNNYVVGKGKRDKGIFQLGDTLQSSKQVFLGLTIYIFDSIIPTYEPSKIRNAHVTRVQQNTRTVPKEFHLE